MYEVLDVQEVLRIMMLNYIKNISKVIVVRNNFLSSRCKKVLQTFKSVVCYE